VGSDQEITDRVNRQEETLKRLARVENISFGDTIPKGSVQIVLGDLTVALPLGDVIDVAEESARLQREIVKAQDEIERLEAKLSNENFVAKAPSDIVEAQREKKSEAQATKAKLQQALEKIDTVA
ncbi:MAG: valine--tRNA ligase, partial [Methyloligellaceae bacterium]